MTRSPSLRLLGRQGSKIFGFVNLRRRPNLGLSAFVCGQGSLNGWVHWVSSNYSKATDCKVS